MINLKEIYINKQGDYCVIYEADKRVYSFTGKPIDVINDLHKTSKELYETSNNKTTTGTSRNTI